VSSNESQRCSAKRVHFENLLRASIATQRHPLSKQFCLYLYHNFLFFHSTARSLQAAEAALAAVRSVAPCDLCVALCSMPCADGAERIEACVKTTTPSA